jgi:hypothetical protein
MSTDTKVWGSTDPISLIAGLGTSPSEPIKGAILEIYVGGALIGTGVTDEWGQVTLSYDASSLLPGAYKVEVRFAGGQIGLFDYDPSSTYQMLYVRYTFAGFQPPVTMDTWNTVKAGQTVPLKWQLTDGHGNYVSSLLAITALETAAMACGGGAENAIPDADTSGSSGLRYDPEANQYIFTFQTDKAWSGTCRQFLLSLSDGASYSADFQFK